MTDESEDGAHMDLPYQQIPEEPILVDDDGPFSDMARKVVSWVDRNNGASEDLRIAAIWGGRGSGKTSMLRTVLHHLGKDRLRLPKSAPDSSPLRWSLFDPSNVVQGGRLSIHLLELLRSRYSQGQGGKPFAKTLELEAKAIDPTRFLDYDKEIASSHQKLIGSAIDFYRDMGARSTIISKDIRDGLRESVGESRKLVLFIDDIDLQPQHAYDLLEILHTYFRDTNVTVLLAADHEQLLRSIDTSLRERKIPNRGLASQLVAKYITAEWRLPTPDYEERERWLRGQPVQAKELSPGYRSFTFESWWAEFRPPRPPEPDRDATVVVDSARGTTGGDESRGAGEPDFDMARDLFVKASPSTWRGLNRLHNRAVTLEELYGGVTGLAARYRGFVGSSLRNVPAFLAVLLALDESFPELMIFEAFEEQPERLRRGLEPGRHPLDDDDKVGTRGWNIDDPADAQLYPVRDRLLKGSVIGGQRRGRAEDLLLQLGALWRDVWGRTSEEEGDGGSFLAISVNDDAMAKSQSWWAEMQLRGADVTHADCRDIFSGQAPISTKFEEICARLESRYGEAIKKDRQQIFAFAPLPVAAWIGWYGRYGKGMQAIGYDREAGFEAFSPPRTEESPDPALAFFVEPVRIVGTREDSGDAAVLIDVRPSPDRSSSALPFFDRAGRKVEFTRYIKLMSEPGFRLRDDEQVARIVHDVLVVLDGLRQDHSVQRIHLAFACPSALAILIGRELHSWTPVLLYQDVSNAETGRSYQHVIDLP